MQNPPLPEQDNKNKFNDINTFLRNVLENESATLEIPHDKKMILVHMDNKTLPLSSLGTGVHEVIILASAATILNETIICIEEPELHLHPLLQKKLIKYLSENTDNQYIFTTHSAHLLDTKEPEIFHIRNIDQTTKIETVSTSKQKYTLCKDLGYKASDILQANCIIWVEGPSDRIYIRYWLKSYDPELIEGIHFSIMFYGGKLLSHLTNKEDEHLDDSVNDLISLRQLNRQSVIVIDSDKTASLKRINKTKKRLVDEFNLGPGFSWVTDGREIENYLELNNLEESIKSIHPSAIKIFNKDKWSNTLVYKVKNKAKKDCLTADKVRVARHYVSNNTPDLSVYNLKSKIKELSKFIRKSNGLPELELR